MALECELKYVDVDLAALSLRLSGMDGEHLGRYLETNLVFDYPDRSLKEKDILLRLREKQGKAVLTVKRPPADPGVSMLKVFEEIETEVGDFDVMKSALEALGFVQAFGYEKVREKWRLHECVICLDLLPFGEFVEIEGTDETVSACADSIGLGSAATTKTTYHGLNIEYRRQNGLAPDENFLFDQERRVDLLRQLGKD